LPKKDRKENNANWNKPKIGSPVRREKSNESLQHKLRRRNQVAKRPQNKRIQKAKNKRNKKSKWEPQ